MYCEQCKKEGANHKCRECGCLYCEDCAVLNDYTCTCQPSIVVRLRHRPSKDSKINNWLHSLNAMRGEDTHKSVCATGDIVVTIGWTHDGRHIIPEGDERVLFKTPELAWELFLCAFEKYRKGRNGKIYWRQLPETRESQYHAGNRYYIYARCFIAEN